MTRDLAARSNLVEMEYAVRGPIPQRAAQLRKGGRTIIPCNIGNPQALGQRPISFYRQVLSLLQDPTRIGRERRLRGLSSRAGPGEDEVPSDYVLDLTERMLLHLDSGLGAYTESKGAAFIRQAVAEFIDRRDGGASSGIVRSDPDSIFLTNGASEAVKMVLEILITGPQDGILVPIPQYPLYSAIVKRCGGVQVDYYLDEEQGWTLDRRILDEALAGARQRGVDVKAIVVVNPGNPTGAVLPERSVREVIGFARENGLLILADEVYQENLYGARFASFARVLGKEDVPLCSFHSASKGFHGECGQRGGYVEVRNAPRIRGASISFLDLLEKLASVSLCSSTTGQALMYLLACPPREGSEPYARFTDERRRVLEGLHEKATMIRSAFAEMEGVECFGEIGALYLFPRLARLPKGTTDFDYCMALLEQTGLCTVNGGGFGQAPGTNHLRIAFLPDKALLEEVLPRWIAFHEEYVARANGGEGR